ncbi:GNAT family N-acetyltransferase [Halobacillus yeomjeoni]|uniref:GNAT family N-acetyltransferase n=1 Tax=Halobacillus yeomjeoni TaxID=311194 RepID=A0A931HWQ1_9BACI|nr:GNAT family N-acetyltransferase [Halobacillus yeomjeoni]MBH0230755.1 GNAT family N-acetyltransferase [Halobacillus yeomjeoni]
MIKNFKVQYIKHVNISTEYIDEIIKLKNQYWNYPIKSHKKWINENINDDDYHLWIEDSSGDILAYLNLVFLKVKFDKRIEEVIGIGNVCVNKDKARSGIGLLLMQICNYYISCNEQRAILLCKKTLVDFYKKANWEEFTGDILLKNNIYSEILMFNNLPDESHLVIDREF